MFQKGQADLKAVRSFGAAQEISEKEFHCEIIRYEKEKECIYLLMKDNALTDISTDCIYRCTVKEEETAYEVTGSIRDRYLSEAGNVLEFKIENGVYRALAESNIK